MQRGEDRLKPAQIGMGDGDHHLKVVARTDRLKTGRKGAQIFSKLGEEGARRGNRTHSTDRTNGTDRI